MKKFILLVLILALATPLVLASENNSEINKSQTDNNDIVIYSEDNKYFGLKTKKDVIVIKPCFRKLIPIGNKTWIIQKNDKFGLINQNGKYIVKSKYSHADRYFDKYSKLGNDHDYGLYDVDGNIILPHQYSLIEPLFGGMFLTCKKYKYGIVDRTGKVLLENKFDNIYMPDPKTLRLKYNEQWYQIEKWSSDDIDLPENVKKVTVNDQDLKVTTLVANSGYGSIYGITTLTDYMLKLFSSISPSYEDTIDELMFSQGADSVTVIMKCNWIPKFPYIYIKKYLNTFKTPNNGPLSKVKYKLKDKMED